MCFLLVFTTLSEQNWGVVGGVRDFGAAGSDLRPDFWEILLGGQILSFYTFELIIINGKSYWGVPKSIVLYFRS